MHVAVAVTAAAPREVVWSVVSDIENAASTISAIDSVEVLERPANGLVGLKWRETRTLFGKSATETMWITDAEERSHYATEARSHGSVYRTTLRLRDAGIGTRIEMTFSAEAVSLGARVLSFLLRPIMRRSIANALQGDLEQVRAAAEARSASGRLG